LFFFTSNMRELISSNVECKPLAGHFLRRSTTCSLVLVSSAKKNFFGVNWWELIVSHICRMRTCSGTRVRWGVTHCMVKLMSQNEVVEGCGIAPGRYFNVPQLIHPKRTHGFARIPPLWILDSQGLYACKSMQIHG
jgi:hypothetical protein